MKRLNGRLKILVLVVVATAALTAATQALAVDQTPKNGCTSPQVYAGALTSPTFATTSDTSELTFQAWFEVEAVAPESHDLVTVEYGVPDIDNPGERIWTVLDTLNLSAGGGGGNPDQGYSNNGIGTTPTFQSWGPYALPSDLPDVQVRFVFNTDDELFQGFRGAGVDAVAVSQAASPGFPTENFESGAPGWSFDGPAGPGGPSWHVPTDPGSISVKSPEINPDLVTLPDSGGLPTNGTRYAWFGDDVTGTYCGPDFANRPDTTAPETTITAGPSGSTASTNASFSFQSSEPDSTFQCRIDGGAFAACPSPQTYSGLARTGHTFEVQAVDPAGNADPTPASRGWTITPPQSVNDLPVPTVGEDVNIQELKGQVKVDLAGGRRQFVALSEARQIPVGSTLDARKGTVRLQSANNSGRRKNGDFSGGIFQVKQSKKKSLKARTDLLLKGGNFNKCRTGSSQVSAALSKKTVRKLRSKAKGGHRSSGKRSAATVRGTTWTVTDRCDGTLTTVQSGSVSVRDFRRKRTVTVRRGKRYLAKAPPNSKSG